MAQFGRKTEGFVASRAVKISGTEAVENYTVSVYLIHTVSIDHLYFPIKLIVIDTQ